MRNNLVTPKRNALAPVTSLYLDAARFVAASVVFIGHVSMIRISGGVMPDLMAYAEGAVVIFFVISGFVIAYVSDTKEFTLKAYATARAVRVYSVAIPAIILTALVDQGTRAVNPGYYDAFRDLFDYAHPLLRALVAITFVNEFWTASIRIFSNGPYWSLSYEVWYYVLLGTFLFSKRSRKIWLPGLILIAVGPRILLLLPIWLMGVGSYHLSKIIRFRSHTLAIPAGLLLLAIPYLHQPDILDRFKALDVATLGSYSSLGYSRYFLWKYLIGGLFSLSVILVACSGVAIKETDLYT